MFTIKTQKIKYLFIRDVNFYLKLAGSLALSLDQFTSNKDKKSMTLHMQERYAFFISFLAYTLYGDRSP